MVAKKNVYKYLNGDVKNKIKTAIVFKDSYTLSNTLKSYTMTKDFFKELMEICINNDDLNTMQFLLDTYYQLWKQDVFEYIIRYAQSAKRYWFLSFIDTYIDSVNKYAADKEAWNAHVAEMKRLNDVSVEIGNESVETGTKKKSLISLIVKAFKEYFSP